MLIGLQYLLWWITVSLEKLILARLVNKLPSFYGTWRQWWRWCTATGNYSGERWSWAISTQASVLEFAWRYRHKKNTENCTGRNTSNGRGWSPWNTKMVVFWLVAPCSPWNTSSHLNMTIFCRSHDEGTKHLRSVGQFLPEYTTQHPRRQSSSNVTLGQTGRCV
jgi:hypothetical protein